MPNIDPFWLLFFGAMLAFVYKLGDALVMRHVIKNEDKFIATLTYLVLGSSIGLIINYLMCQTPMGVLVDPRFTSIGTIGQDSMRLAIVTGFLGAIATAVYLLSFRLSIDPALVVPLSSLTLVYVAIVESLTGKFEILSVVLPVTLIVAGIFLGLFRGEGNIRKVLLAFLLILVVHNISKAFGDILMVNATATTDSITFNFYRFMWLTIFCWLFAFGYAAYQRKLVDLRSSIVRNLWSVPAISVIMILVFLSNGFNGYGGGMSNATLLNAINALPVILTVLASAALNYFWPGIFNEEEVSKRQWALRIVGSLLMVVGIMLLK